MSYRLIDSNELAEKYPEVNDMPCMYADLPNGLDGKHYDVRPVVRGKWIVVDNIHSQCMECGAIFCISSSDEWGINYCPNCGAEMREVKE